MTVRWKLSSLALVCHFINCHAIVSLTNISLLCFAQYTCWNQKILLCICCTARLKTFSLNLIVKFFPTSMRAELHVCKKVPQLCYITIDLYSDSCTLRLNSLSTQTRRNLVAIVISFRNVHTFQFYGKFIWNDQKTF